TPLDRSLTNSMQSLARMAGYDADTRSLYQMSQGLQNLVYSGAMGLRPASAIRQLTQLVPTYADLGAKYTMIGMQKAMEPGGITSLIEKNVLGSPMESLVDAVGVQKGVGRILSKVSEATLYMVSSVDRFSRAATYHGSGAKFDDYLARGAIEKIPFAKKELKDEVLALINKNQPEKAREAYAFTNVAELQYSFGRANRPQAFRGAVGNLAGMFLSYPLNFAEMAKTFAKRATPEKWGYGGEGNPLPLARLIAVNSLIVFAGAEFLNADLRSATMFADMPSSMAIPKAALDTWNMGRTNAEWLP